MDANTLFDAFVSATSFTKIQQLFTQLCALLDIDPYDNFNVFRRLKTELKDWRAQKLWSLLEKRAEQKEYYSQRACERLSVLVIGAGPCGLRSAIECALLGAYVVLVEQRDCFSRNNVLHIWPFVIQDLKNLGIKIFYPKFCRGSIDHISIRQLQIFLVKIALVLGVQIHDSVAFQRLIFPRPNEDGKVNGWRAEFNPPGHILSYFVFDALIGADGKRNTIPGFPKREMRGKLAIGITANFVNHRTLAEEKVQEISGVAYIFNQQFFKDMKEATGIDLENIVYYKDETHYFVMCAKKQSLLEKGVIIEDNEDVSLLLSPSNINQEKLCDYAAEAADFATRGKLPNLKYALNHNGKEDVAMFDFTSLFSAQCSVRLLERYDQRLLMSIVGDSLHEPFWPTGSGCARGFLGVFDAAWMLRAYGLNVQGLVVLLAERESVYRLLAQAKPDNLHKQTHKYTIDPRTRYISLEMTVQPHEISHLIDTDHPRNVQTNQALPLRAARAEDCVDDVYVKKYKLWRFCQQTLHAYHLRIFSFCESWNDGRALAALLGKFRPDLVDYLSLCAADDPDATVKAVFGAVQNGYGIEPPCEGHTEWIELSEDARVAYICAVVEALKNDSQRMRETLMNAIRTSTISHKRKANRQVDASRAKKTEPIRRRASDLLNAFSSTTVLTENEERMVREFMEGKHDVDEEKMRDALSELNDDENSHQERSCKRLNKMAFIKTTGPEPTKYWTKRPAVDKLNPERVYAVEKIISGEVENEKRQELYQRKQRMANILTRKMDKHDIDEMELKLERTAMGLLFNKDQFRVLTSKEQKILSTNAAAARQTVNEGFKHDTGKYKEIDERLSKADSLLKNQNLAGIDIVSRMKNQDSMATTNGSRSPKLGKPLPPLPPGKLFLGEKNVASSPGSQLENQDVVFRQGLSPAGPNSSRPCSMPVIQSCYDSVNARRQIDCQLCSKVVYLAERMQVEGMFIHKKCFRCAFCDQPLRLGNCAQDRNLGHYNPRFFCMQHINLPVPEKIARIQKNDLRSVTKTNGATGVYSSALGATLDSVSEDTTVLTDQTTAAPPVQRTELNSPAVLLGKTMERMRAQKEALGAVLQSPDKNLAPERAEFETYRRTVAGKEKLTATGDNEDCVVSDGVYHFSDEEASEEESQCSSMDEDDDDDDEDNEFMEDELIDLEMAVLENFDKSMDKSLSEAQALNLLKSFKERRQRKSLENGRKVPSPRRESVKRDKTGGDKNVDVSRRRTTLGLTTEASKTAVAANTSKDAALDKDYQTLREEVLAPFMELKEKARLKAKLKTDEELGLCRTGERHSVPRTSRGTSRFPRHLSLELNQKEFEGNSGTPPQHRPPALVPSSPSPVVQTKKSAVIHSVQSLPATPSNRGLLARIFSPESAKSQRSPSKTSQTINCFAAKGEVDDGDIDSRNVQIESQKETGLLGKFSSLRKLRTRKGSTDLDNRNAEDSSSSKDERAVSRCTSTPTSTFPDTSVETKSPSFCQSTASSSNSAISDANRDTSGNVLFEYNKIFIAIIKNMCSLTP